MVVTVTDGWLKIGWFIFIPDYERGSGYAIVTHKEPLVYETTAFEFAAAVAAGANSGFIDIERLEPRGSPPELYDLLLGFDDGLNYFLKYPAGVDRYNPNKRSEVASLNAAMTHRYAMNDQYRLWLLNSDTISIRANNNTAYARTPRVYFEGMKYNIEPLEKADARVAELNAGKMPFKPIPRGGLKT